MPAYQQSSDYCCTLALCYDTSSLIILPARCCYLVSALDFMILMELIAMTLSPIFSHGLHWRSHHGNFSRISLVWFLMTFWNKILGKLSYVLVQAVIIKYHRLRGLKHKYLSLTLLEVRNPELHKNSRKHNFFFFLEITHFIYECYGSIIYPDYNSLCMCVCIYTNTKTQIHSHKLNKDWHILFCTLFGAKKYVYNSKVFYWAPTVSLCFSGCGSYISEQNRKNCPSSMGFIYMVIVHVYMHIYLPYYFFFTMLTSFWVFSSLVLSLFM